MLKSLSILLPTYNCNCVKLVIELHRQCVESKVDFEIIVADDGSSDKSYIEENQEIKRLKGISYIIKEQNIGRAAIRNFLVSIAQKEWLLFIDGDLSLDNPHFISNYLHAEGDVIVGGIDIGGHLEKWNGNLRYRYEQAYKSKDSLENRRKNPSQHLATNFLAHRKFIGNSPYEEQVTHYGYEDVLLGKMLYRQRADIRHIDNPVLFCDFEPNAVYLKKTEEALRTLYQFRNELADYSTLLHTVGKIKQLHATWVFKLAFPLLNKFIKHCLQGNNPSIFWFNVYKLIYYIHYEQNQI